MKRTWIVVAVVVVMLLGGATAASAQFRLDIDIPWYLQVSLSEDLENQLNADFGTVDIAQYAVVIPNLQAYYMFDTSLLSVGVGARIYTVLLMNFLYPTVVGEVRFGKIDVNLNVGGLAGALIGLGPTFETVTGPWVTMDLSAGFRLTDWFRIGVGAFAVAHTDFLGSFPYAIYVSGKFILGPGGK